MTATQFSLKNYRDTFTDRVNEVESGQVHVITKHGKPCAKVVPIVSRDAAAAVARIRAGRIASTGNVRAMIEEGRR